MIEKYPAPNLELLPGGWAPTTKISIAGNTNSYRTDLQEDIFLLENLLSEKDIEKLIALFRAAPKKDGVNIQGQKISGAAEKIGSERVTMWFPDLAKQLYSLMQPYLTVRAMNDFSRTDWWQAGGHKSWQPIALSPLLRVMEYKAGAAHFPHYDSAFIYPDSPYRSLMSVIFYLTSHSDSGATRFLEDHQSLLPEWERQHADWQRAATAEEILIKIQPKAGSVLCFDHRLLHDAECYASLSPRIIIRADLVFEAQ
jgi:hypothetical protein